MCLALIKRKNISAFLSSTIEWFSFLLFISSRKRKIMGSSSNKKYFERNPIINFKKISSFSVKFQSFRGHLHSTFDKAKTFFRKLSTNYFLIPKGTKRQNKVKILPTKKQFEPKWKSTGNYRCFFFSPLSTQGNAYQAKKEWVIVLSGEKFSLNRLTRKF